MCLKVSELINLIKLLEQTWNINTNIRADKERHTPTINNKKYDVKLVNIGKNKINVIKEIKTLLNLGLKESRDFVETLPKIIKEQIEKEEADVIKKKFESLDATIELI